MVLIAYRYVLDQSFQDSYNPSGYASQFMAGKKQFVPEEALSKAMESFWCHGYDATSVQDLVKTMGINRGSLYDTFGDKHALFLASLDHYNQTVLSTLLAQLEAPSAAKSAIVACIQGIVEHALNDPLQKGCLITNTAVELAAQDPEVIGRVQSGLSRVEAGFYRALTQARQKGELGYQGDLRPLAQFLTSSLQGLRVMAKANPDPALLQGIATVILATLG